MYRLEGLFKRFAVDLTLKKVKNSPKKHYIIVERPLTSESIKTVPTLKGLKVSLTIISTQSQIRLTYVHSKKSF